MYKLIDKIENFCLNILRKIGLSKVAQLYTKYVETMRYIIFGGLTTLVNILLFALCSRVIFKNFSEFIRINLSNGIAISLSIAFAYITNKLYVFKSKTNSKKELIQEIGKFLSCRLVTAIIDMLLMQITVVIWQWNDLLMKVLVNILIVILNFVFSKLIIFRNKNNLEKL